MIGQPIPASELDRIVSPGVWSDAGHHLQAALAHPWYRLVSHLLADITEATADFYRPRGFRPALMPVVVSSISSPMGLGSDSLPVEVELFGRKTFLADSLQFQLELLLRHEYEGVYYIMPSFRGEEPDETHLNQFFHSEAEIIGGLADIIDLATAYVRHLAGAILNSRAAGSLETAVGTLAHVQAIADCTTIPRIRHDDALRALGTQPPLVRHLDCGTPLLTRTGEQRLIAMHGGAVWLTHMPAVAVPFYQALTDDGDSLTADLLIGPGEIIGSGERHPDGAGVLAAIDAHQVDPEPYRWYIDMKSAHPLRTAGFGMGIERFLMWLLRHSDIRDLQVFPDSRIR
jgi:asparaginyl-tRNA synthetase